MDDLAELKGAFRAKALQISLTAGDKSQIWFQKRTATPVRLCHLSKEQESNN